MDTDTQKEEHLQCPPHKRRKRSWNSNSAQDLSDISVVKDQDRQPIHLLNK